MAGREDPSYDPGTAPDEEDTSWIVPTAAAIMAKLFAGAQVLNFGALTVVCLFGAAFGADGNTQGDRVVLGLAGVAVAAVTWYLGRLFRTVYHGGEKGVTRLLVVEGLLIVIGVVLMVVERDALVPMLYLVVPAVLVAAPLAFPSVRAAAALP